MTTRRDSMLPERFENEPGDQPKNRQGMILLMLALLMLSQDDDSGII